MTVIKDGVIAEDLWSHVADGDPVPGGNVTVSLERWLAEKDSLMKHDGAVGVRLQASDAPERIADDLNHLGLVVLTMAAFTDGRVFTQARIIRERFDYGGEIRACGDFLRDQMFYLSRMGVNAFEFPEGTDLNDRLKAFDEFSVTYQAATDTPEPLYRRRA
jgi:uncharacterized protein (DUF934 family)